MASPIPSMPLAFASVAQSAYKANLDNFEYLNMLNILNSEKVNAMAYSDYTWEKKCLEIKVKKYNHRLQSTSIGNVSLTKAVCMLPSFSLNLLFRMKLVEMKKAKIFTLAAETEFRSCITSVLVNFPRTLLGVTRRS